MLYCVRGYCGRSEADELIELAVEKTFPKFHIAINQSKGQLTHVARDVGSLI